MSEDDIISFRKRIRQDAPAPADDKRQPITKPSTWFLIAGCTGALGMLMRRMNKGHEL